jgi:hypothetical protein
MSVYFCAMTFKHTGPDNSTGIQISGRASIFTLFSWWKEVTILRLTGLHFGITIIFLITHMDRPRDLALFDASQKRKDQFRLTRFVPRNFDGNRRARQDVLARYLGISKLPYLRSGCSKQFFVSLHTQTSAIHTIMSIHDRVMIL